MNATSFFSIPREKLMGYYPEIISNSSEQYRVANRLAEEENYGMAISHLLISTEEMVKALIIILDAEGFEFRKVKGMDMFFKNHEIRFFIGFLTFIITLFGEDFIKELEKIKKEPSRIKEIIDLQKNKPMFELKLKWYFLRKLIVIKKEFAWFSQAEVFRQNGFYVDMKGDLISPLKLTKLEYKEAKTRIEKVNKTIKYLIESLDSNDSEMKEYIKKFKLQFIQENWYYKMEEGFANARKGRKSFFSLFNDSVLSEVIDFSRQKD